MSQYPARVELPQNDAAPFTPDMIAGWQPSQPRLFHPPNRGWSDTQVTHVAAPFSGEMAQGSQPPQSRAFVPPKTGWFSREPDVTPFAYDMLISAYPLSPRLFHPSNRGWQDAQPTHVAAPFSPDMIQGSNAGKTNWHAAKPGYCQVILLDGAGPSFSVYWATNSNRTIGMNIEPE